MRDVLDIADEAEREGLTFDQAVARLVDILDAQAKTIIPSAPARRALAVEAASIAYGIITSGVIVVDDGTDPNT